MAASNTLLFVADSQAVITTLRCDIKGGVLQVGSTGWWAVWAIVVPARAAGLRPRGCDLESMRDGAAGQLV